MRTAARRRVAVVLEQLWHRVPGGTATSALGPLPALAARADLDLVGVSAHHRRPPPAPFAPPIPVAGLGLPRRLLYETWHRWRWPGVEGATGPVDVIHATGMAVPPRSVPLVVTVHDLAFLHDPAHFTRHGVRFFRRSLDLTRRQADLVVCPSRATLDDCVEHGFDPRRLRLVPWGIDPAPAPPADRRRVRLRYGLDRPYVFWTGTVEPRKNLPTLLDAFTGVKAEVDLVLSGPEGWNEDLTDRLARLGPRVRRLGFVPTEDLRALYAEAVVFCFPSLREGFGLPVLEAMAQGTPVVTSAGTATAEIVLAGSPAGGRPTAADGEAEATGQAGRLVEAQDVEGWRVVLQDLLDDGPGARAMGERGRVVAAGFTWERCADRLADVYREADP